MEGLLWGFTGYNTASSVPQQILPTQYSIVGWNKRCSSMSGNIVICFSICSIFLIQSEFKLGFIAQSCLAPGFSTLMTNLFAMRADLSSSDRKQWQNEYLKVENNWMKIYVMNNLDIRELDVKCTQKHYHHLSLASHSVRLLKYALWRYNV